MQRLSMGNGACRKKEGIVVTAIWIRGFVAVLLTVGALTNGAYAQSCNLPGWSGGAALGTAVYGNAVTRCGAFIYSASGVSSFPGGGDVNLFERYDPSSDTWTSLAPVPTPVGGATLACDVAGGKLFLFGGVDVSPASTNLVQAYTVATNTWSNNPPMPGTRHLMGSGIIGDFIYLVAGYSAVGGIAESQNWQFNPSTGAFTPRTSLPIALGGAGSAVSGGQLYIMGGANPDSTALDTNYAYDPETDTWALKASVPTPVHVPAGVALSAAGNCDGDIILIGGGNPVLADQALRSTAEAPQATNVTQIYDVVTNSWVSGPPLPVGRSFIGAAQAGNTLIATGGYNGSTTVDIVDRISSVPVELLHFSAE
jgi:N-acetylneuraminic acid mutarotase